MANQETKDRVAKALQEIEDKKADKVAQKRSERIPFSSKAPTFRKPPKKDGFVYHAFNDNWSKDPTRIKRALDAGYEFVNEKDEGKVVGTNDDGSAIKAFEMRIPKEFYDEDQKLKHKTDDDLEAQIYSGNFMANPGDKRYMPTPIKKVVTT